MNVLITAVYPNGTTESYTVRRGRHYNLVQALRNNGAIVTGVPAEGKPE